ncbi:MAG TPA: fibronectin type III domain-containing protein [Pseudobacteroides sp.]|uniref:fibronectin type III domain-containing protein n=1 Tax=Pseudobacteroides sp. TaxID=1968840 RepID=UPI002F94A4DE
MLKNLCLKPKNISCLLAICLAALVFLNLFAPKTDLVFAADSNIVPQNTPTPTQISPTSPQEPVVFIRTSFSDITSTSVTISLLIRRYTSTVWPVPYTISFSDGIESIKGEIPVDKTEATFVLTGLKPSTKYSYYVAVAAYGGPGWESFETLNSDNIPTPTPTPKCFISGSIKLDLNSSNIKTLNNFQVDIFDRDLIRIMTRFSDSQGNFYTGSIPESRQPYTVKISKKSYLSRTVANFPAGISNVGR